MSEIINIKYDKLLKYGIPENSIIHLIAGGLYYEELNGISLNDYWIEEEPTLRDELLFLFNTYVGLANLANKIEPKNSSLVSFQVIYLMFLKVFSQNVLSIDKLVCSYCYIDALVICRTMLSKTNLITLFALKPSLYDEWLNKPSLEKYRDGTIRRELNNHSISNFSQTYNYLSELIHGQFFASSEAGMMESGLFTEIPALANKIFVIAKMLLGMCSYSMLSLYNIDQSNSKPNKLIDDYNSLFNFFINNTLLFNRVDNLLLMLSEDRFWKKYDNNFYHILDVIDFNKYKTTLSEFYNAKNPKKLSKIYL